MIKCLVYFVGKRLLKCPLGHGRIKLAGTYKNINGVVQRYACVQCGKKFTSATEDNKRRGHSFERLRIPHEKMEFAKKLFLDGNGYRDVCELVNICPTVALKIRRLVLESGAYNQCPDNYPYCRNGENDLLASIVAAVPDSIPNECREEVCQEMATAVLSGTLKVEEIKDHLKTFLKRCYTFSHLRQDHVSLDEVISSERGGFNRGDHIYHKIDRIAYEQISQMVVPPDIELMIREYQASKPFKEREYRIEKWEGWLNKKGHAFAS